MKLARILFSTMLLGSSLTCGATVNHAVIDQVNLTVETALKNAGSVIIGDTLSLQKGGENSGIINANTIFSYGPIKNMAKGSITASLMFLSSGCTNMENSGDLTLEELHLPAIGSHLKLKLAEKTVIKKIYRGSDYLGGISFTPRWPKRGNDSIVITDDQGKQHTFAGATRDLENILEKALNGHTSAASIVAYLAVMTARANDSQKTVRSYL